MKTLFKVLISAGEASSDIHGAKLLQALREQLPPDSVIEAYGVGGPRLQAAGLRAIVDTRELLTMGFFEVLLRLPKIFEILKRVAAAAQQNRPDLAIVIDYPGFHFRLARKLKKLRIPLIYYIPPKVWVWRKHRVRFLKRFFEKVLCIFPFEEPLYQSLGLRVQYVGNPLLDELPLHLSRTTARSQLALTAKDCVLVIMPGSREAELKHHLETLLSAAMLSIPGLRKAQCLGVAEKLIVLLPFPETADMVSVQLRVSQWFNKFQGNSSPGATLDLRVSQGNSAVCLVAADAGLIKSGTSTLEAGLLRCPHVVIYRPSRTGIWIYRNIIRYKGFVGLVNLISTQIVPEVLCEEVKPELLSQHILTLLTDPVVRGQMQEGFESLRAGLSWGGQSPSACAAREVLSVLAGFRAGESLEVVEGFQLKKSCT